MLANSGYLSSYSISNRNYYGFRKNSMCTELPWSGFD